MCEILKDKNIFQIKDVELLKHSSYYDKDQYSLCVTYLVYTNKGDEYEVTIPRLNLGNLIPNILTIEPVINILKMCDGKEYELDKFNINQIKSTTKEMTIAEIEKELGYRIRIVSEEQNGTNN